MTDPELIRQRVKAMVLAQRALVDLLLRQREQLQGSLFVRYGVCGKAGCCCRQGRRHGPYYVLSNRSGGRGGFAYLEGARVREARGLVARRREFQRGLRRLKRLNLEIVALLKRYQASLLRKGGRRLGLAAVAQKA